MAELLTTREIAQYLRLRQETVRRKVSAGEIPAIKIGGRFRFDKGQIDDWLRRNSTLRTSIPVNDDKEAIIQLFQEAPQDSGYHEIAPQPVTR